MTKNLVVLSKFDRTDIIEPTEQHVLCPEHYKPNKEQFEGFQKDMIESSMPKTWCETCTPPYWGI